ncbi:unnamed protein product [Somion occarium]|uniref:Major facilitator superfamily (MFS) profile domain-containing protein n=1 Tax=Somion occarium TaxID=3059160 RepID=A0ABP1E239_9APHY
MVSCPDSLTHLGCGGLGREDDISRPGNGFSFGPHVHDIEFAEKGRRNDYYGDGSDDVKEPVPKVKETCPSDMDRFLVLFEENDPENPFNWSGTRRWFISAVAAFLIFNATFASSLPAGVLQQMETHFNFSGEVGALVLSLFVLGFAVGPILWGPLSEHYGRRPISLYSFPLFIGTQIGCALSPNTASILIFRFLARGRALAGFTLAPFAGPSMAPLVSGWMNVAGVSWRWVFWLQTIVAGAALILVVFALPETFKPILLVRKAERRRKQTGDGRWWAPLEKQRVSFLRRVKDIVTRPFQMLVGEPMLLAITLYMSFVYGVIYLLFEAYPIVFTIGHHFNSGVSGLMFLPIPIGGTVACVLYVVYFDPIYQVAVKEHHPHHPPPEHRLHNSLYASLILPIAFFWFAWTSYPSVSFWAPMMAGFPLGMGTVLLYLGLFNYIIDTYLASAASALAATVIVRSFFGAGFPLFANQMYDKLSPRWASTLLAFISVVMAPIPFVLRKYGPALRRRSRTRINDV